MKAVAYLKYERPVVPKPSISLSDRDFQDATTSSKSFNLGTLGSEFTTKKINWTWKLDGNPSTQKPKNLQWFLERWNPDEKLPSTEDVLKGTLRSSASSMTIADIIYTSDDDFFPHYGETCRLTIKGTWKEGSPSEAVTYITFPEIDLRILGLDDFKESAETPREVKEGEKIKLANWMHPKGDKLMQYALDLEQWKDDKWSNWDSESEPLTIIHEKKGAHIVVNEPFEGKIRYTVSFKYVGDHKASDDDWEGEEGVLLSDAQGYIEYEGRDWLPYIVGAFAILAILLFLGNLKARNSR